jgi:hypothetical protein
MNEQLPAAIPPPPREVRRKAGTGCETGCLRVFILPHTLVGLFLLVLVPIRSYVILAGAPTQATVDRADSRTTSKGKPYYSVQFHYALNGRRIDSSETWPSNAPTPYVGDQFTGRAASFLGRAIFLRSSTSLANDVLPLAFFALVWNAFIIVFVYAAWVWPLRQRWLAMYGEAAPGVVTKWERGTGRQRNRSTVRYKFTAADGVEHTGKSWVASRERRERGTPITVLYNPDRPSRSLPYEMSDFVVGG